ncbi:hypothetical protein KY334_00490 [Candidatus Woesearchaeota archaeon]|nr:hypothetical protein [Candidatus Woesearchaeota archaeon]
MIYEILQNIIAIAVLFFLSWLFLHLSSLILKLNSDHEYNVRESLIFIIVLYAFHLLKWYVIFPVLFMYFIILFYHRDSRLNTFKIWISWLIMFILSFVVFSLITALIKPF